MKIITGGGGVDADGNAYTLPETEIEVPDDYFKRMFMALSATPKKQTCDVMFVHPDVLAALDGK